MSASAALEKVVAARKNLDEAKSALEQNAKEAVDTALTAIFADATVNSVSFAQKSSEYNDEGMYPGVFGPVINDVDEDDERGLSSYDYSWIHSYDDQPVDSRARELRLVLDAIGEEILSEIFGNESIVNVYRSGNSLVVSSEYLY